MAQTYPIRMQSPEKENGERDTFHPETDIDYVLKFGTDGTSTPLPQVLEAMHPTVLLNTTPTGNGEKIVFAATSSGANPINA